MVKDISNNRSVKIIDGDSLDLPIFSKDSEPNLNEGKIFLADHNKTHELKSVIVTRVWGLDFTANWVLSSGGPYTSKERLFVEPGSGYDIKITGDRNERRLGAVHHLDINISKS